MTLTPLPMNADAVTPEAKVRAIIAHVAQVPPDAFGPDDDLRSVLGVDSLSALRIAARIERDFDVRIPDDQLHALTTLRAIVLALTKSS